MTHDYYVNDEVAPDDPARYSPPSSGYRPRWWNRLVCWCDNRRQIGLIWGELKEMRTDMGDIQDLEQEQYDRGLELVGLVRAEVASLHKQVEDALADQGAKTDAAVGAALTADSLTDAERIKGLLDELATVLPGTVPDVPVPDPGQAAELPTDGGSSDAPNEPVVEG